MNTLKNRDFLKLLDFSSEEIGYLIDLAARFKSRKRKEFPTDFSRAKTSR